jgi:NAD(P)-dependent dehydrogenase (short-subunit alcohol dehydrogenase family)
MIAGERFIDRIAFVTGAGSGIGRATAERIAAEGAAVSCVDLDAERLEETVANIGAAGGTAFGYRCDISDAGAVEDAFRATEQAVGSPDVVCNVAGVGGFSHAHNTTLSEWDRIIAVNLTGTFLVSQAALRRWAAVIAEDPRRFARRRDHPRAVPRPSITNVASSAGINGQPYSAAYCASKGGVVQLTKALAVEYLEVGIRVNAVAPGGVDTALITAFALPEDSSDALLARMVSPYGFAQPADIASAIAFIASEEAGPMTGSIIPLDGGLTA